MTVAVPEVTFTDFLSELDLPRRRLAFEGTLETSFRCNLNCVHCYVNKAAGDVGEAARELSTSRLKHLLDEVVEAGCFDVLFTGGEVMIRPDFAEVYLHALSRGLRVALFTNATMITDRMADLLDEHRPAVVEVSLYGMTKATYEKVTRVPGSFEKCLEGIARLHRRGLPLKLKTMVLSWNVHEVAAMRAFAAALGVSFRHDSLLNPRVDCGANRNSELQVSPEGVLAVDLEDERTRIKIERSFASAASGEEIAASDEVYECGAGKMAFTVDPYGALQLCQLSRRHSFDLKTRTFDEGWNDFLPKARSRPWQKHTACRSCSLRNGCGSCPGAAEMELGDAEGQIASFCEITHLRAYANLGDRSGHRRDATCCLGQGSLAAQPDAESHLGGCGSCGHSVSAPAPPAALIQIERPRRFASALPS